MKKQILTLAAATCCFFAAVSVSSGQTALFSFNDGNGVPNAGTIDLASQTTFTLQVSLAFTPGGSVLNLEGLSYWFAQTSPGSPQPISITNRDVTGSLFTDLQTPGISYPQLLNPSNASDLGALQPVGPAGVGAGNYFIANITFSVDPANSLGTYLIGSTNSGAKTSVITDDQGHTFAIPQALYTLTVVPEPSTWVAGGLVVVALALSQRRRFARKGAK